MKKTITFLILIFLIVTCSAAITNLKIPFEVRLGENLTISGDHGTANILCKFVILDENNLAVERLSDEYTFSDGSFYSERLMVEPPYYRGDDFNVTITCGDDHASRVFLVLQPTSLAHPIQMGWEYLFEESNLEAVMFFATFVALGVICIGLVVLAIKRGKTYAG